LDAGLRWGGSCLPKGLAALHSFAKKVGSGTGLVDDVVSINQRQAGKAAEFARAALGTLERKHIAVLGIVFKPETDDLRDAVSIPVVNSLVQSGASVTIWDSRAMIGAQRIFGDRVKYATNALDCLEGADCCILVTESPEFKDLKPRTFVQKMRKPIVDGRRVYDPVEFTGAGRLLVIGLGPED